MKAFPKDVLVVDFETTGFDLDEDEPVQIGLLLLDRRTLAEKKSFVSWIKPKQPVHEGIAGFVWSNIGGDDIEEIKNALSLSTVAEQVSEFLPENYILCAWNATFDFIFWRKLLAETGEAAKSAQILDLWTMAQIYLLKDEQYKGECRSEPVFQYFGAEPRTKHDALEDCRKEAMVLRKILNT